MNKNRRKLNRIQLVNELNKIKLDEFGEKMCPISVDDIYKYCNPQNTRIKRYRVFKIRKKHGGHREISAPCSTLRSILHVLNIYLKGIYTPSVSAMGFAPGKSVVDNAKMHLGHNYVLNLDLKDFFPSIREARVAARLQYPPFNFTEKMAKTIAGLCAIRIEDEEGKEDFVLPQGAPTSPLLTNAICDSMDYKLRRLASKYGLHYSRYADDMTFSSMHSVLDLNGEVVTKIKEIVCQQGFTINDTKTRLQKRGRKQEVTGLTVNDRVNVAHQYIHDLRCILHIWEKYGYADAYARFYPNYKREKGYIKKGEPVLENVIEGKFNYLRMVKGEDDSVYQKLYNRYAALQPCIYRGCASDKAKSYVFVQSYTVKEFENRFGTSIELRITEKDTLIGYCSLFGKDKFLSIQKNTQNWLRKDGVITERGNVKLVSNKHLPVCYVTLCRQKGMNFWLLTENEPEKIAPVKLNYNIIPVDHLIHEWKTNGFSSAANLFMLICTEGQAVIDTLEETNKKTKSRKAKSPLTLLDEVPANIEEILANLSEHDQIEDLIDDTLSYDWEDAQIDETSLLIDGQIDIDTDDYLSFIEKSQKNRNKNSKKG